MSLTRNFLKSLSLTEEQVNTIISAHADTVDGLKNEITRYQSQAAALPDIQKELDDARQELQLLNADPWQARYTALSTEFDQFRQETARKEIRQAKESAYRKLLRDAGISEKRLDAVLRVSDLDQVEMTDGVITNAEALTKAARAEWEEFISTTVTQGAKVAHPPAAKPTVTDLGRLPMKEYIARRRGS